MERNCENFKRFQVLWDNSYLLYICTVYYEISGCLIVVDKYIVVVVFADEAGGTDATSNLVVFNQRQSISIFLFNCDTNVDFPNFLDPKLQLQRAILQLDM